MTETACRAARWLQSFPVSHQPTIASWFSYAITQGARHPTAVLMIVERLCGHRLDWATTEATRQLCHNTLQALRCDREGAAQYAQHILTQEAAHTDK